jgi:hypothetical protein
MHLTRCFCIFLVLVVFAYGQTLTKFAAGSVAKAGEVYGNDSLLLAKNSALQAKCDSIANIKPTFPIGTVITSVRKPLSGGYMPGDSTWMLADGTPVITDVGYVTAYGSTSTPDLRGMFLRGLDVGRTDGYQDPDVARTAGSVQRDTICSHAHDGVVGGDGSHSHTIPLTIVGATNVTTGGSMADILQTAATAVGGTGAHTHTVAIYSTGGSETRPNNIAVYYYIKVK